MAESANEQSNASPGIFENQYIVYALICLPNKLTHQNNYIMCRSEEKWSFASALLGCVLYFTIAVLFIPVARGSPILRMLDVPFEQAVKYHRWFGYLTVLVVFLHGATYAVYAAKIDHFKLVRVQAILELAFQLLLRAHLFCVEIS